MEVLTPQQRKQFEKMAGKKVDLDLREAVETYRLDLMPIMEGLLRRPEVQKELGLSHEQKQRISEEHSPHRVKEVLKPAQMQRLRQVWLQTLGASALMRPHVAGQLGITATAARRTG